jgi:hypothetical protein
MNAAAMRLLAVLVFWVLAATAHADALPDEPYACRGKRPGDLCAMQDGAGGVCTVEPCGAPGAKGAKGANGASGAKGARPCLACARGPVNTPGSGFPVGFLIVGAVVTLTCATVVIFKLRRHWGDKP